MVKRRSKKKRSGSHGYGSSKKNRGAGNRGGRGDAGRGKKAGHEKENYEPLGEEGFTPHGSSEQTGINLRDIDERIETFKEEGSAEEQDGQIIFDAEEAGYDKVLGGGRIYQNIKVKAPKFSEKAKTKIQESESAELEETKE